MSLHLWRCACWITCNHCFQTPAVASVLICSQPPQAAIVVHLHGRVTDILLKTVPMSRVWEKNDPTSDSIPQEVLCSVSAALLKLACGVWLSCSGLERCRLRPPLPSGPRSVLTGPGRLHGAALEMESRSSARPGCARGHGCCRPRTGWHASHVKWWIVKAQRVENQPRLHPIQHVYSPNSKRETNGKHFNRPGLRATLPMIGETVLTLVEIYAWENVKTG